MRSSPKRFDMARGVTSVSRRGVTLIEMLVVILILSILMGLAFVALKGGLGTAKKSTVQRTLASLAMGVKNFEREFGFLPHAVYDDRPLTVDNQPQVFDLQVPRMSLYALPYYLSGACDDLVGGTNIPIDGVVGVGMCKVNPDGSFARGGAEFEPFFRVTADGDRMVRNPADTNPNDGSQVVFVDAWGRGDSVANWPPAGAIRYYRWETTFDAQTGEPVLNIPFVVRSAFEANDPKMQGAKFAIVSAGPDGLVDDTEPDENGFNADNVVEIGR